MERSASADLFHKQHKLSESSDCEHTSKVVKHILCQGWTVNPNPIFSQFPQPELIQDEALCQLQSSLLSHRHCVIQSMGAVEIKKQQYKNRVG